MAGEEHFCTDIEHFLPETFFQQGIGRGAKILLIGESLSVSDLQVGKAFFDIHGNVTPAGKALNQLLSSFHINLEMCAYTPLIKCKIKNKKEVLEEGNKWWPVFEKQLTLFDFKLLIPLGVQTLSIMDEHTGKEISMGDLQQVTISGKTYHILPLYHPSPVNPQNSENNTYIFNKVMFDLEKIINSL